MEIQDEDVINETDNHHLEDDRLETARCLISTDKLFDISVLLFEAVVGVLQVIDAIGIYRGLFEDAYCNGTELNYNFLDFDEARRLCDQDRYTLDTYVRIWENFDVHVSFNFIVFSILCLIAIATVGLYVYLRGIYNVVLLFFYYYLGLLVLAGSTFWLVVGIVLFPVFVPFSLLKSVPSASDAASALCELASLLCTMLRNLVCSPPLNCAEFGTTLSYPYSKAATAITSRYTPLRLYNSFQIVEDDGEEQVVAPGECFKWASAAGEKLLDNIMKFGNLLYQLSDMARDVIYLAVLSKYSTSLDVNLETTTIIDMVLSFLLILKLMQDLEIKGTYKGDSAEVIEPVDSTDADDRLEQQGPGLDYDASDKSKSRDYLQMTWSELICGLFSLLVINVLLCVLFLQAALWLAVLSIVCALLSIAAWTCLDGFGCIKAN